jgi:hypothetical protein
MPLKYRDIKDVEKKYEELCNSLENTNRKRKVYSILKEMRKLEGNVEGRIEILEKLLSFSDYTYNARWVDAPAFGTIMLKSKKELSKKIYKAKGFLREQGISYVLYVDEIE